MTKHTDDLQDLGRFSEPALLIMISLAEGPKHGYAMTEDIAAISGQRLGPGTLYGGITRLEARGWIEPLPSDDRRRPYKLTTSGHRVLKHRLAALKAMAKVASTRFATS